MSWIRISTLLAGIVLLGVGAGRGTWAQDAVVTGPKLQAIVDAFGRQSTPDQYVQIADALVASPALMRQLASEAEAGRLTGIEVGPPHRLSGAPFAAMAGRKRLVLGADFLMQVAKRRMFQMAYADDILPNNLVFVLGSLAFYLQSQSSASNLERDARACIQGWNDVMEVAVRENGDKPLSPQQHAMLLLNLRYRTVFMGSAKGGKVKWSSSGTLEPTDENVAVIAETLKNAKLLDFGVATR